MCQLFTVAMNRTCSPMCTGGCWGPGESQCLSCKDVRFGFTCLRSCSAMSGLYVEHTNMDGKLCKPCDPECDGNCIGKVRKPCLVITNWLLENESRVPLHDIKVSNYVITEI